MTGPVLYVKAANREDTEKEWQFVRNMPPDENGLTNEWYGVSREDFETKALPQMIAFSEGKGLPEGYVPETFLFLWDDDRIVGQYRIRHYLCESLRTGAGHIGYFIGKEFRSRGYGTEGLRLTLEAAREIVPEEEFYLRVNRSNPASLHVMLKNGGRIVREDEDKYYVRIPNPGKKHKEKNGESMIRKVERADLPACVRVIRDSFRTVADEFGFTEENAPRFTAFAMSEDWLHWQMDGEHRLMYLAEEDGVPCGYYSLQLQDGGECELSNLSVLPEYRHRGIGTELLRHAAATAKEQGCTVINLGIVEENRVLREWYERNGAVHTGTKKFDFFPFTCGYMKIQL